MNIKDWVPWHREKDMIKAEADHPIFSLQREMNKMFDSFSQSLFDPLHSKEFDFSKSAFPKIDVVEAEKEIKITAELPGMEEKDIDVSLSGDLLIIEGEKKAEKEDEKDGYRVMERSYGKFNRAIQVPTGVESEKIDAKFKNGVLKITLPKTEEAQKEKKKIKVEND